MQYSIYVTEFSRNLYNKVKPVHTGIPNIAEAVSIIKAAVVPLGKNVTLFSQDDKPLVSKYQFKEDGNPKTGYKIFDKSALGKSIDALRPPMKLDVAGFKSRIPNGKTYEDFKADISIIELATKFGYSSQTQWAKNKTSAFYPCLENAVGDKIIIINPRSSINQRYFNPEDDDDRGDLISFTKRRRNKEFSNYNTDMNEDKVVNSVLYDYLKIDEPTRVRYQQQYQESIKSLPAHVDNDERIFIKDLFSIAPLMDRKYLHHEGISDNTIDSKVFAGKLLSVRMPIFNDAGEFVKHNPDHVNTGFGYYSDLSNEMTGIEVRNFGFKGHGVTSLKAKSVGLSNVPQEVKNIIYVEGYKDALSHYELQKPEAPLYIMLGGRITASQLSVIEGIVGELPTHSQVKHKLAFDNDLDGSYYDVRSVVFFCSSVLPELNVSRSKDDRDQILVVLKNDPAMFDILQHLDVALADVKLHENSDVRLSYTVEGNNLHVAVPRTIEGQEIFCKALLKTVGLSDRILIEKAVLNDFNDDLKALKGMKEVNEIVLKRMQHLYPNFQSDDHKKKVKPTPDNSDAVNMSKKAGIKM